MRTEVWTARVTVSWSCLPMALAMTTLVPSEMPMNRLRIRLMIGVFAPTAAMPRVPSGPGTWPMTTVAMRLESCSRMLVAATGNAKSGMAFHRFPVSMPLSSMRRVLRG